MDVPEPDPDPARDAAAAARPGTPGSSSPTGAPRPTGGIEGALDWCFRNRHTGQITIAQFPNVALGIFIATFVARLVVPEPSTAFTVLAWLGAASLGWWALDEVIRGVNPWRRLLGVGGCVLTISAVLTLLR